MVPITEVAPQVKLWGQGMKKLAGRTDYAAVF